MSQAAPERDGDRISERLPPGFSQPVVLRRAGWKEPVRPRREVKQCRYHGGKYPLPASPMCAHPDCIRTWLYLARLRSVTIRRVLVKLNDLCLVEDFVQHMAYRYLYQLSQGKTPMMRPLWILYEILDFFEGKNRYHRREELVPMNVGRVDDDEDEEGPDWEMTQSDVDAAIEGHLEEVDARYETDGYSRVLYDEVSDYMLVAGFRLELLALRGDVSMGDVWRLEADARMEGLSLTAVDLRMQVAAAWVSLWASYREGVGDVRGRKRRKERIRSRGERARAAQLGVGDFAFAGEAQGPDGGRPEAAGDGVHPRPGLHRRRAGRAAGAGAAGCAEVHP